MTAPTSLPRAVPPRPDPVHDLAHRARVRRGGWLAVLALPCARHAAAPGAPCWTIPRCDGTDAEALCGRRIKAGTTTTTPTTKNTTRKAR